MALPTAINRLWFKVEYARCRSLDVLHVKAVRFVLLRLSSFGAFLAILPTLCVSLFPSNPRWQTKRHAVTSAGGIVRLFVRLLVFAPLCACLLERVNYEVSYVILSSTTHLSWTRSEFSLVASSNLYYCCSSIHRDISCGSCFRTTP